MAGRGPAPKDPARRARRNKQPDMHIIVSEPVKQPALPKRMPTGEPWPQMTRAWWRMWGKDPLAQEFRATDWAELRDAAVLHGAYWTGDIKVAGELRLRMAKFGATQEDRARLRIQYAQADEAEDRRDRRRAGKAGERTKARYSELRAVD